METGPSPAAGDTRFILTGSFTVRKIEPVHGRFDLSSPAGQERDFFHVCVGDQENTVPLMGPVPLLLEDHRHLCR